MSKTPAIWSIWVAMAALAAGCSNDDDGDGGLTVAAVTMPPAQVAPRESTEATVAVTSASGAPRAGVQVQFTVERGGGALDAAAVAGGFAQPRVVSTLAVTDDEGHASVRWLAGVVPVENRLRASVGDDSAVFATRVVLAAPLQAEQFGDIPELLRATGYFGEGPTGAEMFLASTEDLAFVGDDTMLLGLAAGTDTVDGAIIAMDPNGDAALLDLTGDPLIGVLGIAVDRDGGLWAADPRAAATGALLRVSTDGVVETVLTAIGEEDLDAPNYVAVGPDGRIYVSDPCIGVVFRYDPASESVDGVLRTDVASQGGPNGLAFDAGGEQLYFTTESIALLCGRGDLPLTDPVGGLFRVSIGETGFGDIEPIAERQALFGDGLAFDVEGNLYVTFDTEAAFMLEESAVWVLPADATGALPSDGGELVKFLASGDKVYANLAWGRGAFGEETMYIALLAVDAFGLPVRGVERIEIGIAGLPLLP
jgi:hypothetical protein